jgi:hypothetical protein
MRCRYVCNDIISINLARWKPVQKADEWVWMLSDGIHFPVTTLAGYNKIPFGNY